MHLCGIQDFSKDRSDHGDMRGAPNQKNLIDILVSVIGTFENLVDELCDGVEVVPVEQLEARTR